MGFCNCHRVKYIKNITELQAQTTDVFRNKLKRRFYSFSARKQFIKFSGVIIDSSIALTKELKTQFIKFSGVEAYNKILLDEKGENHLQRVELK